MNKKVVDYLNETLNELFIKKLVVKNPNPKLVKLIKDGNDGGNGEFDEFLPEKLRKICDKNDVTYFPYLEKNTVVWEAEY